MHVKVESISVNNSIIRSSHGPRTTGLLTFDAVYNISLIGSRSHPVQFANNIGSCMLLYNSNLHLQGEIVFSHNIGCRGAALTLFQESLIYVVDTLNATFKGNLAESAGGAIYAESAVNVKGKCTFQVNNTQANNPSVKMTFIDNAAIQSGSAIYSTHIYQCYIGNTLKQVHDLANIYHYLFNFTSTKKMQPPLNNLSTIPNKLILCSQDLPTEIYIPDNLLICQLEVLISIIKALTQS